MNVLINNIQSGKRIGFVFTILILLVIGVLISVIFSDYVHNLLVGTIAGGLLIILFIIYKYAGFYYLIVEQRGNLMELKYYQVFPYGRKFKMIQVQKDQLRRVDFEDGFLGLGRCMILFQMKKGGVAKYPKIWLSALNKKELTQIKELFRV